eukprot:SAG22_NODE_11322_length_490_cov_0.959079_1_plen_82_part_01
MAALPRLLAPAALAAGCGTAAAMQLLSRRPAARQQEGKYVGLQNAADCIPHLSWPAARASRPGAGEKDHGAARLGGVLGGSS